MKSKIKHTFIFFVFFFAYSEVLSYPLIEPKEKPKPKPEPPSPGKSPNLIVANDGTCGIKNGKTCPEGQCCSTFGYCGTDDNYCIYYCDPEHSECKAFYPNITQDGTCGIKNGKTCPPGECCSTFGYCGKDDHFCKYYCDEKFSECKPSDPNASKDGLCGIENGKTCPEGECCSIFGYCGQNDDFCKKYCDSKYGECEK